MRPVSLSVIIEYLSDTDVVSIYNRLDCRVAPIESGLLVMGNPPVVARIKGRHRGLPLREKIYGYPVTIS